jgi:hypothetical protein
LDTHTGKQLVVMEMADRAEMDDKTLRVYQGQQLVAVFNRDKVFGYEVQKVRIPE